MQASKIHFSSIFGTRGNSLKQLRGHPRLEFWGRLSTNWVAPFGYRWRRKLPLHNNGNIEMGFRGHLECNLPHFWTRSECIQMTIHYHWERLFNTKNASNKITRSFKTQWSSSKTHLLRLWLSRCVWLCPVQIERNWMAEYQFKLLGNKKLFQVFSSMIHSWLIFTGNENKFINLLRQKYGRGEDATFLQC